MKVLITNYNCYDYIKGKCNEQRKLNFSTQCNLTRVETNVDSRFVLLIIIHSTKKIGIITHYLSKAMNNSSIKLDVLYFLLNLNLTQYTTILVCT